MSAPRDIIELIDRFTRNAELPDQARPDRLVEAFLRQRTEERLPETYF